MPINDVIRGGLSTLARIPAASRAGLLIIGLGLGADVIAHLDAGLDQIGGSMTGPQLSAHLVVFIGMVVVLAGVVVDGVRSPHAHRALATHGRHSDALR